MRRRQIDFTDGFADLCQAWRGGGAFLVVQAGDGKPNGMTIGWGSVGVIWGEPVLSVLVRPSRYSFGLMEKAGRFSVCVPPPGRLDKELAFCGSRSGRDCDKAAELGLKVGPGQAEGVWVLEDCGLFYECETVHKTKVVQETLDAGIASNYYPQGDFHTLYQGRILHAYRSGV